MFGPCDPGEIITEFYTVLNLEDNVKQGRTMSPSAVMWWLTQNEEAREALFIDPRSLRDALTEFRVWYNEHQPSRFWANDPDFDGLILAHALSSQGMHAQTSLTGRARRTTLWPTPGSRRCRCNSRTPSWAVKPDLRRATKPFRCPLGVRWQTNARSLDVT